MHSPQTKQILKQGLRQLSESKYRKILRALKQKQPTPTFRIAQKNI
jgi:hypothetical protein